MLERLDPRLDGCLCCCHLIFFSEEADSLVPVHSREHVAKGDILEALILADLII